MTGTDATRMTAADLIALERTRQVEVLGYDRAHDEHNNTSHQLVDAAKRYIDKTPRDMRTRVSNLVKAAALLAAEIDLLRNDIY